jgi:hypothetical protein
MNFEIHAWQPHDDGGCSAWKWYWFVEIKNANAIVAVIQQPHHIGHYETKSDAEAAAHVVIDGLTKQE